MDMRFLKLWIAVLGAISVICLANPAFADDTSDKAAVRSLLMATFDKPGARLTVEPVTVEGDLAVAGWAQGDMGGRALLRKKDGTWTLTLCSGDALKDAAGLKTFGLSAEAADALSAEIVAAEAKLDPALVAKFSTFDGVVMMDGSGQHPPAEDHGNGQHKG
jgi:hypothetical protein